MDENTTYAEYRHAVIARYGHSRLDQRWLRTTPADEQVGAPTLVCELDVASEFDLWGAFWGSGTLLRSLKAGVIPPPAVIRRIVVKWIERHRPKPGGGLVSVAWYRRRVGPPDEMGAATPGPWFQDPYFRRPGRPMIGMDEAVPLVEAALNELDEPEADARG